MKVLLAVHLFFPAHRAGTEVLTLELARSLRAKGHEVSIVTCVRHDHLASLRHPWVSQEVYDSFDVYQLNFGLKGVRDSIGTHINAGDRVQLLLDLVATLSPDLVHFTHINGFSSAAIAAIRKIRIPVFFSATDYWAICPKTNLIRTGSEELCLGPKQPADCVRCYQPRLPALVAQIALKVMRPQFGALSKKAASLYSLKIRGSAMAENVNCSNKIFVSTSFLARLLAEYGVERHLIRVVPYGVRLGNMPERIGVPASFNAIRPLRVAFIGSFTRIKGAHVLLEALGLLTNSQLENLAVYVYGSGNSGEPEYADRLKQLASHANNAVTFMGTFPHENIGEIIRSMHMVVVPSIWYESAPLVLCSALAAGVPVLVSRLGGMTEIVKEGVEGFSFAAGSTTQLAALITRLLGTPEWFRELLTRPESKFRTPDDYADDIELEYLRVAGSE